MKIKRNLTLCVAILLMAATVSTGDSCYTFCETNCGTGGGSYPGGGSWERTGATSCFCTTGNMYNTCEVYPYTYCTKVFDAQGIWIPSQSSRAFFCSVGSYCL